MRAFLRVLGFGVILLTAASAMATDAALADAAEHRDQSTVEALLGLGVPLNAPQPDGMTALHWAVYHEDERTTQRLIKSGANVNATNRYGVFPLHVACLNGNGRLIKLLLDAGAEPNARLRGGESPLMTAARTGCGEGVQELLARGATADAREQRGQTALMWAAAEGHLDVVSRLLDAGANPRETTGAGFTPLLFAIREGHTDVALALLSTGIDINAVVEQTPISARSLQKCMSPLSLAVENGHFELATDLLAAGADPNDQRSGVTPLHRLVRVRKPDRGDEGDPSPMGSGNMSSLQFARKLIEFGADIDRGLQGSPFSNEILTTKGATPFFLAARANDVPYMELLIELGADVSMGNTDRTTPLMVAAGLGTNAPDEEPGTEEEALEAVQLLLGLGEDINAVDDRGESAMHGAAYKNLPRMVAFLTGHGADIAVWNRPNIHGWTPLSIAEGYRPGNFKPSQDTIEALHRVMSEANVPLTAPHPAPIDQY